MPKKLVKKPKEAENGYWKWDKKTLTQDDWDFHWIKGYDPEVQEAVLIYECARELNQIRKLEIIPEGSFNDPSVLYDHPLLSIWPLGESALKYFPETSSRKIPTKVIHEMGNAMAERPLFSVGLSGIEYLCEQGFLKKSISTDTYQRTETIEITAFEIDWELGHRELKKRFGNWLKIEGQRFAETRKSYFTLLKALGTYRLLDACSTFEKASKHTVKPMQECDYLVGYLYSEASEWSKAKTKAKATIISCFPSLPLSARIIGL
jgi:hypothetical protein